MSDVSTTLDARHFAYVAAHTQVDDAFALELKSAARAAGLPSISIAVEQASFLSIALRAIGARRVVEVGTLAGYSALWMARALGADGRVTTFEKDPKHARFAREWLAKSDVASRIDVIEGDAAEHLPRVADGWADAAFLDADKGGYPFYLEHALRIVRVGGLILVDNAFAFGQLLDAQPRDRDVPAVRAFNERMANEPRLSGVIVPLGDGLWFARKKRLSARATFTAGAPRGRAEIFIALSAR